MKRQHLEVPSYMGFDNPDVITWEHALVYAYIKQYADKKTALSYISLENVGKRCEIHRKTVAVIVEDLKSCGYIDIIKTTTDKILPNTKLRVPKNVYKIIKTPKNFEMFDFAFLENPLISPRSKGCIILLQPLMLNKNTGESILPIRHNDMVVRKYLNCSISTLKRIYKDLESENVLVIKKTKHRDENGLIIVEKLFNMGAINRFATVLAKQNEKIESNTKDIKTLKDTTNKQLKTLQSEIENLKWEMEKMKCKDEKRTPMLLLAK